jgi:hypothetical protein
MGGAQHGCVSAANQLQLLEPGRQGKKPAITAHRIRASQEAARALWLREASGELLDTVSKDDRASKSGVGNTDSPGMETYDGQTCGRN